MLQRAFIKSEGKGNTGFAFTVFAVRLKERLTGEKSIVKRMQLIKRELSSPTFVDDELTYFTNLSQKITKDLSQLEVAVRDLQQSEADPRAQSPDWLADDVRELKKVLENLILLKRKICTQAAQEPTVLVVFSDDGFEEPSVLDFMNTHIKSHLQNARVEGVSLVDPVSLAAPCDEMPGLRRSSATYAPHVVVVFRGMAVVTVDAEGSEQRVVQTLEKESYISTQFWVSPDGPQADVGRRSWTDHSGDCRLCAYAWSGATYESMQPRATNPQLPLDDLNRVFASSFCERELPALCSHVVDALQNYEVEMLARRRGMLLEWNAAKDPAEETLTAFIDKASNMPKDAMSVKTFMTTTMLRKPEALLTSLTEKCFTTPLCFDMPDHEVLKNSIPAELSQTLTGVFPFGEEVTRLDEQMVRVFMCKILFGKSIDIAQELAQHFYEQVGYELLLPVAQLWGISAESLLDEMRDFCIDAEENKNSPEILALRLLMPENLESMYVGSLVLSVSPILHTMVEPCLSSKDLCADRKQYDHALRQAKAYYQEKSSSGRT